MMSILREIEILKKLSNMPENIYTIKLRDVFTTSENISSTTKVKEVWLVTDYYSFDLGSLFDRASQPLTEKQALSLVYHLL